MKVHITNNKWLTVFIAVGLVLLTVTPALAWWSSWYTPGFSASYSPGSNLSYRHGQENSSVGGGTEKFASQMKWNQADGNGVRNYSNNTHFFIFCGWCLSNWPKVA